MVTRLRVGPHNREPQAWNRQLLMMRRLPHLFPCIQEIDFDQVLVCLGCRMQQIPQLGSKEQTPCHSLLLDCMLDFLWVKLQPSELVIFHSCYPKHFVCQDAACRIQSYIP